MHEKRTYIHSSDDLRFDFFEITQVGKMLHLRYSAARRIFLRKDFPSKKVGNRWLVNALDFIEWYNNL